MRCLLFMLILFFCLGICSQESVRDIEQEQNSKYLTPNQTDCWKFHAQVGEVVIARVKTEAFDATLKIVDGSGKILDQADDIGSDSQLLIQILEVGEYEVQIHGYKNQGGGLYQLELLQFLPTPIEVEKSVVGTFDTNGISYHVWMGEPGQILLPHVIGPQFYQFETLDTKGKILSSGWQQTITVERKGLHCLVLRGQSGSKYTVELKQANVMDLNIPSMFSFELEPKSLQIYNISGKANQIILIQIEKYGILDARFIFSPVQPSKLNHPLQFFPVSSKGHYIRFAIQLLSDERYQLHLLAQSMVKVNLKINDPTHRIEFSAGEEKFQSTVTTPIGGCEFFRFSVLPGQLFKIHATSNHFDTTMKLYSPDGKLWQENDDGVNLSSELSVLFQQKGDYLLQVGSVGNGGGGTLQINLNRLAIPILQTHTKEIAQLHEKGLNYWSLSAQTAQNFVLSARSLNIDLYLEIHSPSGMMVARNATNMGQNCLLSFTAKEMGLYTISVSSRKGYGNYILWAWCAE